VSVNSVLKIKLTGHYCLESDGNMYMYSRLAICNPASSCGHIRLGTDAALPEKNG